MSTNGTPDRATVEAFCQGDEGRIVIAEWAAGADDVGQACSGQAYASGVIRSCPG